MAAKKQDAKTSAVELTATERTLLDEVHNLKHRLVLMEEARRLVIGVVEFLMDLQAGKYPFLPEKGDTAGDTSRNPDSCRCHASPPTCGSLDPYPVPDAS